MAKFVWDESGKHLFETGVDHGILYVNKTDTSTTYDKWTGVVWNGLTGVTESPSGAEDTTLWADNIKYLTLTSAEEFGGSLTCYTYPDEWKLCDGAAVIDDTTNFAVYQQARKRFCLGYRTKVGNDVDGSNFKYKHHIIYNASATPSERAYSTVNDSPEAIEFSYELSSTPVEVGTLGTKTYAPTSLVTFESNYNESLNDAKLKSVLELIEDDTKPCPTPKAIYDILGAA